MFKVNNKNIRWRRSGVFIGNFEHISQLFQVFLVLTLLGINSDFFYNY